MLCGRGALWVAGRLRTPEREAVKVSSDDACRCCCCSCTTALDLRQGSLSPDCDGRAEKVGRMVWRSVRLVGTTEGCGAPKVRLLQSGFRRPPRRAARSLEGAWPLFEKGRQQRASSSVQAPLQKPRGSERERCGVAAIVCEQGRREQERQSREKEGSSGGKWWGLSRQHYSSLLWSEPSAVRPASFLSVRVFFFSFLSGSIRRGWIDTWGVV